MSRNDKIRDQTTRYFVSIAVVYWIDVFIRLTYKERVIKNLKFCQKEKDLELYAWGIMSSHIHLMIGSNGKNQMQDRRRDFKKHTLKKRVEEIQKNVQESRKEWMLWMFERAGKNTSTNKKYPFWQQHHQPIELSDSTISDQKLHDLHMNSVVSEIVDKPEDYL